MNKYIIKSIYDDHLKKDLTFSAGQDDVLLFNTQKEAEDKMIMYGCVNCHVKEFEIKTK